MFLQETHPKNNSHSKLKSRLVGQVYHSNFSTKTRGTAILVWIGIPFLHKTTIVHKEGRYVTVIGEVHSTSVNLLNIYSPVRGAYWRQRSQTQESKNSVSNGAV